MCTESFSTSRPPVGDVGRHEWAEKIEKAAEAMRPDWDERPDVIIDRLSDDLHAEMRAEWRQRRRRGAILGRDDTPAEGPQAGFPAQRPTRFPSCHTLL